MNVISDIYSFNAYHSYSLASWIFLLSVFVRLPFLKVLSRMEHTQISRPQNLTHSYRKIKISNFEMACVSVCVCVLTISEWIFEVIKVPLELTYFSMVSKTANVHIQRNKTQFQRYKFRIYWIIFNILT